MPAAKKSLIQRASAWTGKHKLPLIAVAIALVVITAVSTFAAGPRADRARYTLGSPESAERLQAEREIAAGAAVSDAQARARLAQQARDRLRKEARKELPKLEKELKDIGAEGCTREHKDYGKCQRIKTEIIARRIAIVGANQILQAARQDVQKARTLLDRARKNRNPKDDAKASAAVAEANAALGRAQAGVASYQRKVDGEVAKAGKINVKVTPGTMGVTVEAKPVGKEPCGGGKKLETNDSGKLYFAACPAGKVEVSVKKTSFRNKQGVTYKLKGSPKQTINVGDGKTVDVTFTYEPTTEAATPLPATQ